MIYFLTNKKLYKFATNDNTYTSITLNDKTPYGSPTSLETGVNRQVYYISTDISGSYLNGYNYDDNISLNSVSLLPKTQLTYPNAADESVYFITGDNDGYLYISKFNIKENDNNFIDIKTDIISGSA
jgi:hypothetical protein